MDRYSSPMRMKTMHSRFTNFLFGVSVLVLFTSSYAQEGSVDNRAAQYHLGSENELLIPINVWGFVGKPGQYLVPDNIDLMSLLSFAGGPTVDGKIRKVKIVRSNPDFGRSVMKVNLKKYIQTANQELIPTLKPGDTVIIRGTAFHGMSRFFEFVSRMAVVAQIFYFVALAQEYLTR